MARDWANDHFVRLFTRDTDDDLLLSWEARAVWHEMLKRCDQSGLIETKRGVRGLAALIRVPVEVVERVLQELLEDGRIRSVPSHGFVVPNYTEAQFTPRSNNARKDHSRTSRRLAALTNDNRKTADNDGSRDVTCGHEESHAVAHNITDTSHEYAPTARDTNSRKRGRKEPISESWEPRDDERHIAVELGLDCDIEAREFKAYWLGDGRPKADWDQTFANRLYSQAKKQSNGSGKSGDEPREIPEL